MYILHCTFYKYTVNFTASYINTKRVECEVITLLCEIQHHCVCVREYVYVSVCVCVCVCHCIVISMFTIVVHVICNITVTH